MLTGLATGVAGAVTKPLSGAFDAVSEVSGIDMHISQSNIDPRPILKAYSKEANMYISDKFTCVQTGNTILRSTGLDEGVQHLRRTKHGSLQLAPSEHLYFRWKVKRNDLLFLERVVMNASSANL